MMTGLKMVQRGKEVSRGDSGIPLKSLQAHIYGIPFLTLSRSHVLSYFSELKQTVTTV